MGRRVENPFKEQGIPSWIRYFATGLAGFVLAWMLLGGNGASPVDHHGERVSSSFDAATANAFPKLRPKGKKYGVDDDGTEEFQNDDWIASAKVDTDDGENSNSNSGDEGGEFPAVHDGQVYLEWVRSYLEDLEFQTTFVSHEKLTQSLLEESLRLGCDYMAANQKEKGNFNYQYDFVKRTMDPGDMPVRQAGALWGMTLCFQSLPENPVYRAAVERGIAYFQDRMRDGPVPGSRMIHYPGFDESQSGVNALYGLSLIDYIRTMRDNELDQSLEEKGRLEELHEQLGTTIEFLKYMQNDDLHFSEYYEFTEEEKSRDSSPYYDGETLLCLVKAAKYMDGYSDALVPLLEEAAPVVAKSYTLDAWRDDTHDSARTKGFYQWSSMAFTEYYFAEWENYEYFGDLVLVLAHWIVHTHDILDRQLNTGYAFEGIISAFRIAQERGHNDALTDLEYTIDEGLYKLGR